MTDRIRFSFLVLFIINLIVFSWAFDEYPESEIQFVERDTTIISTKPSADEIVKIAESLFTKGLLDSAEILLLGIVENTPPDYKYRYEDEDKIVIEFWSGDEFMLYTQINKIKNSFSGGNDNRLIVWKENIYPKSYYMLGWIEVERGNYESALLKFYRANKLEPNNPKILNEIGHILVQIANGDKEILNSAFEFYKTAHEGREYIFDSDRAGALRGMGFSSIELGKLEEAKSYYEESLEWSDSELAKYELKYIQDILDGRNKLEIQEVKTQDGKIIID